MNGDAVDRAVGGWAPVGVTVDGDGPKKEKPLQSQKGLQDSKQAPGAVIVAALMEGLRGTILGFRVRFGVGLGVRKERGRLGDGGGGCDCIRVFASAWGFMIGA